MCLQSSELFANCILGGTLLFQGGTLLILGDAKCGKLPCDFSVHVASINKTQGKKQTTRLGSWISCCANSASRWPGGDMGVLPLNRRKLARSCQNQIRRRPSRCPPETWQEWARGLPEWDIFLFGAPGSRIQSRGAPSSVLGSMILGRIVVRWLVEVGAPGLAARAHKLSRTDF